MAVAVVKAWIDGEPPGRLKIRITSEPLTGTQSHDSSVAATVDDACAMIRRWLEAFVASDQVARR